MESKGVTGRYMRIRIFFLVVVFISGGFINSVYAEYINLESLLTRYDAICEWNPITGVGRIKLKNHEVIFKVGGRFILIDYTRKITVSPIITREGKIMVPSSVVEKIESYIGESEKNRLRIAVIMIDPGHGGKDPGTIGVNRIHGRLYRLREKDVVLKVGLMLRDMLKKRYPYKRIVMTRTKDVYPTLEERVKMANSIKLKENEAMIFVSIHANASFNKEAHGFEIWYLPPTYRRELINKNDVKGNKEIVPILNSMLEEEYTIESITLARYILEGLKREVGGQTISRGLKAREWYVVRKAKMPSVLIEIGFITNPGEMLHLEDSNYLKKVSLGIYNGICKFVSVFESGRSLTE